MFEIETEQLSCFDETQTIVSELSDGKSCQIKNFKSVEEINEKMFKELSKLTLDKLKDKCKIVGIQVNSKSKKTELIGLLMMEFEKTWIIFKNLNKNEVKEECKKYKIKGISGLKKEELLSLLMNYYSENLIINSLKTEEIEIKEIQQMTISEIQVIEKEQTNTQLSLIEELEKQKQDIERKMLEEIERQRIELEKKRQEELERQQAEEEEKLRIELEKQKEKEKEKEEKKKKKQAIPKNVRNIVWNHYIGEDIIKHRCLCCKKVLITNTNFEVGHVLSEKNGGTHEINNLRPICGSCNHSMGIENMIEFVVKYGLYIG
jgi:5-methylcytosine-specific restriction endonuclease McrA